MGLSELVEADLDIIVSSNLAADPSLSLPVPSPSLQACASIYGSV